jgi:septal ring factor EnvC (AmiA/AmiB activator)
VRAVLILLLVLLPAAARAQSADVRLRQQRAELEEIRRERDSLQAAARELQGRVRTLSDEVNVLARQAAATNRLIRTLDQQLSDIQLEVDTANQRVAAAQSEVTVRRDLMRERIRDIYKRGPLFATEAFLAARSFGELIARYKYLHELALYDRAVVKRVESLYEQIDAQRQLLVRLQDEFQRNREEKQREQIRLRDLEAQRTRALAQTRRSAQQVQGRLTQTQRDAQRVAQLIAAAEAAARSSAGNAPAPSASSLKTSDFGTLDWPVEGAILYTFGRAVNPNNTAIRWNGIGIEAPLGTPVKAISVGEVMVGEPIGTYCLTVIVQHGGGDFSVFVSLKRGSVALWAMVTKG